MIVFDFDEPAEIVYAMGVLDIDYESSITVSHLVDGKIVKTVMNLKLLGDNSYQTLEINIAFVKQIKLTLSRSGAVTSLAYCYPEASESPSASPSESPSEAPSPSPSASPSEAPTESPTSR